MVVRIGKVLPTVTIIQIEVNAYYVSVFTYLKWIICMELSSVWIDMEDWGNCSAIDPLASTNMTLVLIPRNHPTH